MTPINQALKQLNKLIENLFEDSFSISPLEYLVVSAAIECLNPELAEELDQNTELFTYNNVDRIRYKEAV